MFRFPRDFTGELPGIRCSRPTGFALIACLLLVAFFTVLLSSMAVLVTHELRETSVKESQRSARQHARLAMQIAVGELSRNLGHDARATRVGYGNDDNLENRGNSTHGWLSVWDTSVPESPVFQQWMVSGQSAEAIGSSVLIEQGEASLGLDDVDVPFQEMEGGGYAWHVSDEATKAQIFLGRGAFAESTAYEGVHADLFQNPGRSVGYYFQLANEHWDGGDFPVIDAVAGPDAQFLQKVQDLKFLNMSPTPRALGLYVSYSTQELTVQSLGVLSRTDGTFGLKTDLSLDADSLGPGLRAWLDHKSYIVPPDPDHDLIQSEDDPRRFFRIQPYNPTDPEDGEFVHVLAPVITDVGFQFSPAPNNASDRTAYLSMRTVLELWNPYAQIIEPEEMTLEVYGVPDIEVLCVKDEVDLPAFTMSPIETFGEDLSEGQGIKVDLAFVVDPHASKVAEDCFDAKYWGGGRVKYWVGRNNTTRATPAEGYGVFGTKSSNATRLHLPAVPGVAFPDSGDYDSIRYRVPASSLTFVLRRKSDGAVLARLDDFEWDAADTAATEARWDRRFITFQARKFERSHTIDLNASDWMRLHEPRGLHHEFGDLPEMGYTTKESTGYSPDLSPNTLALSASEPDDSIFERVLSAGNRRHNSPEVDSPLFDIPTRALLSIGELQHVVVHGKAPFAVGNSWGNEKNSVFDTHFFSGQQVGVDAANSDFRMHPAMRALTLQADNVPLANDTLMVSGRFNVNSLSARAWATMLAVALSESLTYMVPDSTYDDNEDDTAVHSSGRVPPALGRFSFSQAAWLGRDLDSFRSKHDVPPSQFFQYGWQFIAARQRHSGVMSNDFQMGDTSLLSGLASAIVDELRSLDEPIVSLERLINDVDEEGNSLLERAIASVPELRQQPCDDNGWEVQTVDERLPAWVLPSDLMTVLAPILSVRGDTFRVRAYGRSESQFDSDGYTEAWCEAVIQRLPDVVDIGGTGMTDQRKFEMVSFRWLNESEL
ncbi:MAG: hypothetical protein HRU10_00795 [Opitutales bacterium]|nr:hypothetical protein [Opitutales bacterium]